MRAHPVARTRTDTLPAALPREMVRVAGLIALYEECEGGILAVMLMRAAIDRAQAAIEAWDAADMVAAGPGRGGWGAGWGPTASRPASRRRCSAAAQIQPFCVMQAS